MDAILAEFIRLCDEALARANRVMYELEISGAARGLKDAAALTVTNLGRIKESALAGRLPRPSRGAGLGLTREVGEWAEDDALLEAVRAAERYYRERM